jgi:hypothetical protein
VPLRARKTLLNSACHIHDAEAVVDMQLVRHCQLTCLACRSRWIGSFFFLTHRFCIKSHTFQRNVYLVFQLVNCNSGLTTSSGYAVVEFLPMQLLYFARSVTRTFATKAFNPYNVAPEPKLLCCLLSLSWSTLIDIHGRSCGYHA